MLAACGGGVTKKDVIARADGICANAVRAVRAAQASIGGAQKVAAAIAREAKQLRALPRPAEDHALLDRYIAAIGRLATEYRDVANALRAGNQGAVSTALAALRTNPAAALAARYGLRECAGARATVGSG
jgi:hypothetical protein